MTTMQRVTACLFLSAALLAVAANALIIEGLQLGFYNHKCREAESVITDVINTKIKKDPTLSPGLIRLFFHDCFITGCDASILLDSSPSGDVPEKESSANSFTLHGLELIDLVKTTLEGVCPNTVSCADILAFAARDAAVAAGLPRYDVVAGRRDGTRSNMEDLPGNFPIPSHHVPRLAELFSQRGLSLEDLVVLSGAHSIGGAHCFMFTNRLYGFSQTADVDPTLDPAFAARLRQMCPRPKPDDIAEKSPKINFEHRTGERLDNVYYQELLQRKGLMTSDNALVEDGRTRPMVEAFARDDALWQHKFAQAMQTVGKLDVLIGEGKGQVRKSCRVVNGMPPQQQQQQQQQGGQQQQQQQGGQQQPPWMQHAQPWMQGGQQPWNKWGQQHQQWGQQPQQQQQHNKPFHPFSGLVKGFFRGFT